ncbi:tetratricopeptide repeat protein [Devosia psychrophila]|uniref:Sel1 repeat-containing protein n=1 Tax=Devosia psychrophila TaxID=728005 RepID=A0A0F5PZ68_9HYPH|nr:SEL1-like repeat protein [Devosia psychrophila]KKC33953.1 hypothetical protein WH91_05705 [Devosia psychrophila]SFD18055.1 Sel1 repeat-containing protein [Devosia psychrophila]
MFARTGTKLFSAAMGTILLIVPAFAQSPVIEFSPDANFACLAEPVQQPNQVWKSWDGATAPADPQDMLRSATIFAVGSETVVRDRAIAYKLFQYLAASDFQQAGRASLELSKLLLDESSGYYDPELGIQTLQQRADIGDVEAIARLGAIYSRGGVVPQDDVLAERYLKQAAAAQDISAVYRLAQLYAQRTDLAPMADASNSYFQLALSMRYQRLVAGDCSQLEGLGDTYADQGSAFYDSAKAAAWYEAGFRTGDADAAKALGQAFLNAEGVDLDRAKALEMFKFAAGHGRVSAMVQAADLLLSDPTDKSRVEARELLERAASYGESKTYETLAQIAAGQFGGASDPVEEIRYLRAGAATPNASPSLLIALGKAWETGSAGAANFPAAFAAFRRAADFGEADAYLSMYALTASGRVKTTENPIAYVRSAASLGEASAMAELARAYACGTTVSQNLATADLWRNRAAAAGDSDTLVSVGKRALVAGETGEQQYFRDVRRAARTGDVEGQILLSEAYLNGVGTAVDTQAADRWRQYALSNELRHNEALLALARLELSRSVVGPTEVAAALEYLNQADSHNPSVAYELGKIYLDGVGGTVVDRPRGIQYLMSAAGNGYVAAMVRLASLDLTSEESGGKSAQDWLNQAVGLNSVAALLIKADRTESEKNREELLNQAVAIGSCNAKELVSLAAALTKTGAYGDTPSVLLAKALALDTDDAGTLLELADYIRDGVLQAQDDTQNLDLLHRAALGGEPEAMRQLAGHLLRGDGGSPDIAQARSWLTRALAAGDDGAVADLVGLLVKGGAEQADLETVIAEIRSVAGSDTAFATSLVSELLTEAARVDERYQSVAMEWVTKAANDGDASAMMLLSNAYALGLGVTRSMEESSRWLEAAAQAGNVDAFEKYAVVLELGLGVTQDSEQAQMWLDRAAKVKQN